MEVAGLAVGAVALASLFSTCIECFDHFTAAKSFEVDFQILMVKLDIEKARLLTWGNDAGLLRSESEGRLAGVADAEKSSLVSRCLKSITGLLSNASKLEEVYGLQKASGTVETSGDIVSANSMNVFRTSHKRFWVRFAKDKQRASTLSRTKWAIYDRTKFGKFIQDLKDLVDGLNEVLPARREQRDQVIQNDIASILDISKLRLVESACDESYMNWSTAASAVIEESQIGTVDRRNIEEWMMDTADITDSRGPQTPIVKDYDSATTHSIPRISPQDNTVLWILCTPPCPLRAENDQKKLCCNRDFGLRAFDQELPMGFEFDANSPFSINEKLNGRKFLKRFIYGETRFPIYCSFCVCQIHTALEIAKGQERRWGKALLRPDNSLPSSCWSSKLATEAYSAIMDAMDTYLIKNNVKSKGSFCWDREWIEQQQYHLEASADLTQLYKEIHITDQLKAMNNIISSYVKEASVGRAFMILGEPELICRIWQGFNFPTSVRAPRERELHEVTITGENKATWTSKYLGRYLPRNLTPSGLPTNNGGNTASQSQGSTSPNISSRRRPVPPSFDKPNAKRTKDNRSDARR